jgi:hypothetical protein
MEKAPNNKSKKNIQDETYDVLIYSNKDKVYFLAQRIIDSGVLFMRSKKGELIKSMEIVNTNYGAIQVPEGITEIKAAVVAEGLFFEKTLKVRH